MIDKTFIEKILSLADAQTLKIDGQTYTSKPIHLVEPAKIGRITMSSLKSVVNIVKAEIEKIPRPIYVNVKSHVSVECFSGIFNDKFRDFPYSAEADLPHLEFDRYIPIEQMIITLKSKFAETEDREYLIKLLGNITDQNSVQTVDDGITQSVTAKSGISLSQKTTLNPIVTLRPYRTFLNVEQPQSDFLIRLKDGCAALFEADGGRWKLEAKKNIADFLRDEFGSSDNIIVLE